MSWHLICAVVAVGGLVVAGLFRLGSFYYAAQERKMERESR